MFSLQPKEIKDLKDFIQLMRNEHKHLANASKISIKKCKKSNATKFKLRTPRYLYTHTVNDRGHANKIIQSVPPFVKKHEVKWAHTMLFDDKTGRLPKRPQSFWAVCDSTRTKWVEQRRLGNKNQVTIYSRLLMRVIVRQMLCLFFSTLLINNCN